MHQSLVNDSPYPRTIGFAVADSNMPSTGSFTLAHTIEPLGCGDGHIDSNGQFGAPEACDDGANASGDGCAPDCRPEPGWACDYQGQCVPVVCGDGMVNGDEQCDDNNANPADGCSESCMLEPGYLCGGEPYACSQIQSGDTCGNAETLVDGNYDLTDYLPDYGCNNTCSGPDRWFTVSVPPGQAFTVAVGSEGLSGNVRLYDLTWNGCGGWMNNQGGDAYNAGHVGRLAWVNSGNQPSTIGVAVSINSMNSGTFAISHALRPLGCGDGFVDNRGDFGPPEACDDGNTSDADGCSAGCEREDGWLCGDQMPTQCVVPPPGDMCESAELLQTGSYSLAGFNNECGIGGCNPDRWLETTVASGELLVLNMSTNAEAAYARLWDLTNGTCNTAGYITSTWMSSGSPAQFVWQAPAGGGQVALQLENPSNNPTYAVTVDMHTGLPACGDGYADYGGWYGPWEDCDDGNTFDGDACPSTCHWE